MLRDRGVKHHKNLPFAEIDQDDGMHIADAPLKQVARSLPQTKTQPRAAFAARWIMQAAELACEAALPENGPWVDVNLWVWRFCLAYHGALECFC